MNSRASASHVREGGREEGREGEASGHVCVKFTLIRHLGCNKNLDSGTRRTQDSCVR